MNEINPYESPLEAVVIEEAKQWPPAPPEPWWYAPWYLWAIGGPCLAIVGLIILLVLASYQNVQL